MEALAILAQEEATQPNYWPVWGLFLLAGLLIGGVWSAYQNSSKVMTTIMAVLAAAATLAAVMLLIGEMG